MIRSVGCAWQIIKKTATPGMKTMETMEEKTMTIDLDRAGNAIADLYEQLADLQERVAANDQLMVHVSEALMSLTESNRQLQNQLTISQLKQLKTYGVGGVTL
jgi:NH3-dependent NAD+ synthetase